MQKEPNNHTTIELSAVIVAVSAHQPQVMALPNFALPSGPFSTTHRTLEQGLRDWVAARSGLPLGYVEQLYTFADKDRSSDGRRIVSIGYLALVRNATPIGNSNWSDWYQHLPWEDHRNGIPEINRLIIKGLNQWKSLTKHKDDRKNREARIAAYFPSDGKLWNEELVLQRYELLWEAGLLAESKQWRTPISAQQLGKPMPHDHRRILATGIARLRAKIKYRPVVFELLPDRFSLLELQSTVEALAGLRLHKQNFRRLVLGQGLVEETTSQSQTGRGRPAQLFAFRHEVLRERAVAGTKLPRSG